MSGFHVVLVEPEIPPNTGNIARTCAATGCSLELVRPLGFRVDDRTLKRAGLDYWHFLDADPARTRDDDRGLEHYAHVHRNLDAFFAAHPGGRFWYATSKGKTSFRDVSYQEGDFLLFGPETRGLSEDLLAAHPERCVRIPMVPDVRCLNLSNSVAVLVYEALRQAGYPGMK